MECIRITHFSDTLCVWAYVSQVRMDELQRHFGTAIEIDYRYLHVFGNVRRKMDDGWKDRGGLAGYSEHVRGVVNKFGHVALNPHTWLRDAPSSSMPAHLFLCAVRLLEAQARAPAGALPRAAWAVREAFFRDARDISNHDVLLAIAESLGLSRSDIEAQLRCGAAHAALADDLETARAQDIKASPTLLFNEGRQRLTGNVGYRIIEANIRELLEGAPGQLSWC
jgi:predicted DsbA family dithiol-disulfide isomerase